MCSRSTEEQAGVAEVERARVEIIGDKIDVVIDHAGCLKYCVYYHQRYIKP